MMLPASLPCEAGGPLPVGTAPATTVHCTGVGVRSPGTRVSQPVVSNQTTPLLLTARFEGPAGGVITHVPLGGAGGVTGAVVGVQPLRVTVSRFDLLSWSTTPQAGAGEPEAWVPDFPSRPAPTPPT